jgi:hypothetical protein
MTSLAAHTLKELVDSSVDTVLFPVKKNGRINIGSYSIKFSKGEYSVKCYRTNTVVATTITKAAALAIAKRLNKNKSIDNIIELDNKVAKHKNDCMFYKYTIDHTTNEVKREVTQTRYDISKHYECVTVDKIKQFLY